jgi:hypothetical protein
MTDTTDNARPGEETDSQTKGNGIDSTTLGERGSVLPIGIETASNEFLRDFEFRRWRMKEEKLLGQYKEDNPGQTIGEFISHLLGVMLTKLGPHQWNDSVTTAEKQLVISQLYLGDVLYLYSCLRKSALGKDLDAVLQCPNCTLRNERVMDVDDLDVLVLADPEKLIKTVVLEDGLRIFGEVRKTIHVRPPRWQVMSNPEIVQKENEALRTVALFKDCVCGAEGIPEGQPVALLDEDIDEMSKSDIVTLEEAIEDTPGPRMAIEFDCTRCKVKTLQMIDYRYESFFTKSSPSLPGKS